MKSRIAISLFAVISAIGLSFGTSAFVRKANIPVKKPVVDFQYFQYSATGDTEEDYETQDNWTSIGATNPSTNPCNPGSDRVCVIKVDQTELSGSGSLVSQLIDFLAQEASAKTYVESNFTYQKELP